MIKCSPETLARYKSYYTNNDRPLPILTPEFEVKCASKKAPNVGTLPLWEVYRGDQLYAYVYGCFHGQRLMTPQQEQLLLSTGQLFIEHDFWTLDSVTQQHLVTTYGVNTDERCLNDGFYRMGRKVTALDKFREFRYLEDRYTQYVRSHIDSLSRQHTALCDAIDEGRYDLDMMRDIDRAMAPEMRDFLDVRHRKWLFGGIASLHSPPAGGHADASQPPQRIHSQREAGLCEALHNLAIGRQCSKVAGGLWGDAIPPAGGLWGPRSEEAIPPPVSIITGLGHVYPILKGLESRGYRFRKVLT